MRWWVLGLLAVGAACSCNNAEEVAAGSATAGDTDSGTVGSTSATMTDTTAGTSESASGTSDSTSTTAGTSSTTQIDIETDSTDGAGSTTAVGPGSTGGGASTGSVTAGGTSTGDQPACAGPLWEADFTVDPTTLDVNQDNTLDWVMRDGSDFPVGELSNGVWNAQTHVPLDTRPRNDFTVRTLVEVEMQSVETGSDRGATFWINVDYENGMFAPLFFFLNLDEQGTQDLQFYGKTDNSTNVLFMEMLDLPAGFINLELDIDPQANQVGLWVDGAYQGVFDYPTFPPVPNNDDRFGTVFAWTTDAEFNYVRIEQCPEP